MEIDDQAAFMQVMYEAHIAKHGGKISEDCEFCKLFFVPDGPKGKSFESYKFIIFDVSDMNLDNFEIKQSKHGKSSKRN